MKDTMPSTLLAQVKDKIQNTIGGIFSFFRMTGKTDHRVILHIYIECTIYHVLKIYLLLTIQKEMPIQSSLTFFYVTLPS